MTFLVFLARRGLVIAIATVLVTALVWSATASSPLALRTTPASQKVLDFTPVAGATFNRPVGTPVQQRAIFTVVNHSIDAAPAGSTIRIAVFSFSEKATADKLIAAHSRGVNVQLIFDDHIVYAQEARLRSALGANPNRLSFTVLCHLSCRGTSGNMHDKLFLFSQAGRAQNVVMVGSDNLTGYNAERQWSDMYTVVDDAALYFTYAGVFDQMKYDRAVTRPYIRADVNGFEPQFYPAPGVTQTTDPVLGALDQITCTGVPAGAGSKGRTTVRISHHAWNGTRGVYLARKVAALETAGCDVRVIYGVGMGAGVKRVLSRARVPLSAGTHKGIRTHEKYLLVNGWYGADPTSKIVWTGSHNWSDGALRRDDLIVRIESPTAYGQYLANFNDIWTNG